MKKSIAARFQAVGAQHLADLQQKRVVLENTSGPRKGLFQICGSVSGLSSKVVKALPEMATLGKDRHASLIKVTPRFALYREVFTPPASGKLGQFHPSQR